MSLSGLISKEGIVYISYNGGDNKILDQNFNGTRNHSMTSDYNYIKLTVYSSISNWTNGTNGSATSSVSVTYHGSYDNFIA